MKRPISSVLGIVSVVFLVSMLPDAVAEDYGEGRALLQDRCTFCHDLNRVKRKVGEYSAGEWDEVVTRMQKKGARVKDSEKEIIVKFLSTLDSGKDL